jgi:hypothetical protein
LKQSLWRPQFKIRRGTTGSATKAGHTSSVEEEEDARHAWGGQKASGERRRKRGRSVTFGTVEKRELGRGGGEFRHAVDGRKGLGGSGAWQSGVGGADDHSARAAEPGHDWAAR